MELTDAEMTKFRGFLKSLPETLEETLRNRPADKGEVIESHFFLIPRILPYEGNGSKKRLFWLKTLDVRVNYFYRYATRVTEVDESGWEEQKVFVSVPWFNERAITEGYSANETVNTNFPPNRPRLNG
jgi:hypothetical protein